MWSAALSASCNVRRKIYQNVMGLKKFVADFMLYLSVHLVGSQIFGVAPA